MEGSGHFVDESVTIEKEDTCTCEARITALEDKLTATLRKMMFSLCILGLITLAACGACIFMYTEILKFQKETASLPRMQSDGGKEADGDGWQYYEYLTGSGDYGYTDENDTLIELQVNSLDREKRKDVDEQKKPTKTGKDNKVRHGRGNRGPKCCKRLDKKLRRLEKNLEKNLDRMKREITNMTSASQIPTTMSTLKLSTPRNHPGANQRQNYLSHVAAAHYTSIVTNDYIKTQFQPLDDGNLDNIVMCTDKPEWHGKLCRNRIFQTSEAPVTLKMFKEAEWMKNVSSQRVFDMNDDGVFIARHTGIYLVYAHVLFYDAQPRQAIELVHDSDSRDENTFLCTESDDHVTPQSGRVQDTRHKSCSVNAVVYMEKSDTIRIQTVYPNLSLDLTRESTYFGGLVFASVND